VGRDCILGLGRKAFLSPTLLTHLQEKSLLFLDQCCSPNKGGLLGVTWLNSSDLDLDVDFTLEWDGFIQHLKEAGVSLLEGPDSLIWTGGD